MKRRKTYPENHRSEGNSDEEGRTDRVVNGGLNSVLESGEHGEDCGWVGEWVDGEEVEGYEWKST